MLFGPKGSGKKRTILNLKEDNSFDNIIILDNDILDTEVSVIKYIIT